MLPHLVAVHGSRLASSQWLPQLPLWKGRATVGLVDLPGHGRLAGEPFTLERCVEVVDEAVDEAPEGAPVVLVGHSLGGYVAMAYAEEHASRMADHQRLFHQDLGRILRACDLTRVGENVAYGNVTPAQLVKMWMDSPGHRANILASRYRLVAVGAARSDNGHWYTSQVFGTR